jgi:hypothetical protein
MVIELWRTSGDMTRLHVRRQAGSRRWLADARGAARLSGCLPFHALPFLLARSNPYPLRGVRVMAILASGAFLASVLRPEQARLALPSPIRRIVEMVRAAQGRKLFGFAPKHFTSAIQCSFLWLLLWHRECRRFGLVIDKRRIEVR